MIFGNNTLHSLRWQWFQILLVQELVEETSYANQFYRGANFEYGYHITVSIRK